MKMPKKNIIDKIWESHVVRTESGAGDILFVDLQFLHEVTSPQAFEILRDQKLDFLFPERHFATIDHSIPTDKNRTMWADKKTQKQVEKMRENCKEFGIKIFDVGSGKQGIVHIIGPELGLTLPGTTVVCGDSHTATHGAFGAMGFGIGTTQVSHVMATQSLLLKKPKTMKVDFFGTPDEGFSPKDAALALIRQIGMRGGTEHAIEFCGDFVRNLSMEGRMTICNMAIECGAKSGLISPDEKTFEYLRNREFSPKGNLFDAEVEKWKAIASDDESEFDLVERVDLSKKKPFITWGTSPEQVIEIDEPIPHPEDFSDPAEQKTAEIALKYTKLKSGTLISGTKIDVVFIGSCTNGRIEDLREVASIFRGEKVAKNVRTIVVPGSENVKKMCIEEGLDEIFLSAGAEFREPGCSMCLAMNGDFVPEGARCASTSNRNFIGRQGKNSITHLMSPRTAAFCAIRGEI